VSEPVVVDNPEASRFELRIADELAGRVDYLPAGDSVIIAHTEVAAGHEGEGLGGVLVVAALEGIRAKGKTAIPTCPFAAAYIRRHPELDDYVKPALRESRNMTD
jgi:predicted GNAT family acetyltransferase